MHAIVLLFPSIAVFGPLSSALVSLIYLEVLHLTLFSSFVAISVPGFTLSARIDSNLSPRFIGVISSDG